MHSTTTVAPPSLSMRSLLATISRIGGVKLNAVFAFYAMRYDGMSEINATTVRGYYRRAGRSCTAPGDVEQSLRDSKRAGFLKSGSAAGWFSLTPEGTNLVAELCPEIASGPATKVACDLRRLASGVLDTIERDYITEAIKCLEAGCLRAGVIMAWQCGVWRLRQSLGALGMHKVNNAYQQKFASAKHAPKQLTSTTDLAEVKDTHILALCKDLNLGGAFDSNLHREISELLDYRNRCGHPSSTTITEHKASATISSIIENILRKV